MERVVSEVAELLLRDASSARLQLYQRLLYSPALAAFVFEQLRDAPGLLSERTRALLRSIDRKQLEVEREARIRNLAHHLERACQRVAALMGAEAHGAWVRCFVDAPVFWEALGRSLGENYCLFIAPQLEDPLLATVAQLDGILSGLPVAPARASPWSGEVPAAALPETRATEIFVSPVRLLGPGGALPTPSDRALAGEAHPCTIAVALYPPRRTVVLSLGVDA